MHELKHLGPQGVPQHRTYAKNDHQCRKHIVQTHFVFIKCVSSTICQRKMFVPKMWLSPKQNATLTQWSPSPLVTALKPHHSFFPACSTPGGKYRKSLRSLSLDAGGNQTTQASGYTENPPAPPPNHNKHQRWSITPTCSLKTYLDLLEPTLLAPKASLREWQTLSYPLGPCVLLSVSTLQQTLSGWGGHSASAEWLSDN